MDKYLIPELSKITLSYLQRHSFLYEMERLIRDFHRDTYAYQTPRFINWIRYIYLDLHPGCDRDTYSFRYIVE